MSQDLRERKNVIKTITIKISCTIVVVEQCHKYFIDFNCLVLVRLVTGDWIVSLNF